PPIRRAGTPAEPASRRACARCLPPVAGPAVGGVTLTASGAAKQGDHPTGPQAQNQRGPTAGGGSSSRVRPAQLAPAHLGAPVPPAAQSSARTGRPAAARPRTASLTPGRRPPGSPPEGAAPGSGLPY